MLLQVLMIEDANYIHNVVNNVGVSVRETNRQEFGDSRWLGNSLAFWDRFAKT